MPRQPKSKKSPPTFKRGKNFLLTVNEKSLEKINDIIEYLTGLSRFQYILVTKHIGSDNDHDHIFVQYQDIVRLTFSKLHGSHLEVCRGSAQKNIEYCKAEDRKHKKQNVTAEIVYEDGEPIIKGGLKSFKDVVAVENPEDIDDARLINVWKTCKGIQDLNITVDDLEKEVKVFYIQGPSGIGKTNHAKAIIRAYSKNFENKQIAMIKHYNNFWIGASRCDIAFYDDFRDSQMKPSEFINFIDYNKHIMNTKNGFILNNYKLIVITSVQKLEDLYSNMSDKQKSNGYEEPNKQWLRRISRIDFYTQKFTSSIDDELRMIKNNLCHWCYVHDKTLAVECQCLIDNKRCNCNFCYMDKFINNKLNDMTIDD